MFEIGLGLHFFFRKTSIMTENVVKKNYMDDPKKVYENLKQLLTELQKVKDLNNLANEYKTISANLVLSLQDYLNNCRAFSDAFNNYLLQTNKSTEETKEALNNAIQSMNNAIRTFSVADGTVESKVDALIGGLNKLEMQAATIESFYNKCLSMEQKMKIDVESLISKANEDASVRNNMLIGKIDTLLSSLKEQICVVNSPLIEQLNTLETKIEIVDSNTKHTETKIQIGHQQISEGIRTLCGRIEQSSNTLAQHQNMLQNEHKEISAQVQSLRNDLLVQITQSKKELISSTSSNERSIGQYANIVLGKIDSAQFFQKVIMGVLAIILVLVIVLIFK